MNVVLKLYATLSDDLPQGAHDNRIDLTVDEDETVGAIIARHNLPEKLVHLVLVNGAYVQPGDRATRRLSPGDHLAIWPPIAGG
jgi:sulfur carrier protein ThiS